MIVHLCHPPEYSCFAIDGEHVRTAVNLISARNVSNDYLVPIHGRANTRDSSVNSIVIGDLVRPDKPAAILLDCEKISAPIGEVNRVTIHGRGSRNIATRGEHPFRRETLDVGRADRVLSRLAPGVA